MDEKPMPPGYEKLDSRANLVWLTICALAGAVVVLGGIGYEVIAELLAAALCLGLGSFTLMHLDVFDRFYRASMSYWTLPPTDRRYQKRLDGLENARQIQRIIMPPFAILVGLAFLAIAIETIAGLK